jgi:hypothetical protein
MRGPEDWKAELQVMRSLGIRTIVLQYSGDEHGNYDDQYPEHRPVRSLLAAADQLDLQVLLGLYADERWPHAVPDDAWLPPPLGDPTDRNRLFQLCAAFNSCMGWYIPQEIDDSTWGNLQGAQRITGFLSGAVARLHESAPRRPIAVAPFFAEALAPEVYAAWWEYVLQRVPVEIVMMQDGTGARGTPLPSVARLLQALAPALARNQVELWSIVEVFQQTAGSPIDEGEFAAIPAGFAEVNERLRIEHPLADRTMVFSLLDYMAPQRGEKENALYQQYARYCSSAR